MEDIVEIVDRPDADIEPATPRVPASPLTDTSGAVLTVPASTALTAAESRKRHEP